MSLLITICARGGSKGIPGKNIRPVNGQPLIAYSIRHAQMYAEHRGGADIALSTDSDDIRRVAAEYGLKSDYVRPAALASDSAGKLPVLRDLVVHEETVRGKTYEYILDLDVTSPLRTTEDLDAAFAKIEAKPDALNIFTVSFPTHNPYFDMVEEGKDGFVHLVKKPAANVLSRQEGPKVYDENASFYFYRRAYFEQAELHLPDRSLAYLMPHPCFEIDAPLDMDFLEYLLKHDKLNFSFPS
ncbi:MAG TPA: acylneuraminate cytidylyltransferase family protein [Candidatus Peribacter riflensis]|uniref:Cytidylyltransferase n=1 Tax=Candidatus Peribacter riflensis TaxID=1735162 RepID=A0A0S1SMN1_9BACT|nr:MAG: cytidylyltransferase [Candidatus Peribacter riflensis]OGJ78496.1 MAG: cytidyltransferase [Candidatus Peribacteria bacterium RIFOXYB1_FULL_57_12]ALM11413.1 MAG: cytidylyltransferase [Candidatus Peribacter riflensis]ALM12515.1 MAG: cytidylyltransferase [Candidatus Peribacter riflensis]ALM13616.1 MAG: cytidylyltransferase [Candidatus Peribacter riflensis]